VFFLNPWQLALNVINQVKKEMNNLQNQLKPGIQHQQSG